MKVGVPRETWPGEHRVSLIPSAAAALKKAGLDVVVEEIVAGSIARGGSVGRAIEGAYGARRRGRTG